LTHTVLTKKEFKQRNMLVQPLKQASKYSTLFFFPIYIYIKNIHDITIIIIIII